MHTQQIHDASQVQEDYFTTPLGAFSRSRLAALLSVRHYALASLRSFLYSRGFREVTVSSLVNIAGSCENPSASFSLPYYGREAHLSQSAQLQLESIVLRLQWKVFTVNNSFREEDFEDPTAPGRRLSEFTLIEPECPYSPSVPDEVALGELRNLVEDTVRAGLIGVLRDCEQSLVELGSDILYLQRVHETRFATLSYEEAAGIIRRSKCDWVEGSDLGIREELAILREMDNIPTFITGYPASLKFFNLKTDPGTGRSWNLDLIAPRLGELVGGGLRETNIGRLRRQLENSKIHKFLQERGSSSEHQFHEYLRLFHEEDAVPRFGFGVGFERFVGFLLQSNDILETITYRSLKP